jgi:hypothetical protein
MTSANAPSGRLEASLLRSTDHWVLPPEKVQRWFREANVNAPSQEVAANLALKVIFLKITWPLERDKKTRKATPFDDSAKRIGIAIATLRKELPGWLDEYSSPLWQPLHGFTDEPVYKKTLQSMSRLREVIDLIVHEGVFRDHLPVMGRPREAWYGLALALGEEIVAALKASGVKSAGFGKGTSPALRVLKSALRWLGVHEKDDALIMAMRRNRERGKKVT